MRRHCWHYDPGEDDPDYCCRCGFEGFCDVDTTALARDDQGHHALCRNSDAACRLAEWRAERGYDISHGERPGEASGWLKYGPPNWQWEQDWSEFWPEPDWPDP